MEQICSMSGCNNTSKNTDLYFFKFPNNFELCIIWVQSCDCTDLITNFTYEGVKPFLNKFICSNHFKENDFIDPNSYSRGLNPTAVPSKVINFDEGFEKIEDAVIWIKKEACSDYQDSDEFTIMVNANQEPEFQLKSIKTEFNIEASLGSPPENFAVPSLPVEYQHFNDKLNIDILQTAKRDYFTYPVSNLDETEERGSARNHARAQKMSIKRANETKEERQQRLYKNSLRNAIRRSIETPEERLERQRKNAERVALKRKTEPEDKKELRRLKDRIRSAERRKRETVEQSEYRHYIDAVRSAFRRHNETEQQREHRRKSGIIRAAKRRGSETAEQRNRRLQCDRERSARRRMLKKFAENIEHWCDPKHPNCNQITDNLDNFIEC